MDAGLRWRVVSEALVGLLLLLLPETRPTHFPRPVSSMMPVHVFLLLLFMISLLSLFLVDFSSVFMISCREEIC